MWGGRVWMVIWFEVVLEGLGLISFASEVYSCSEMTWERSGMEKDRRKFGMETDQAIL